jgi:hypothetical protein
MSNSKATKQYGILVTDLDGLVVSYFSINTRRGLRSIEAAWRSYDQAVPAYIALFGKENLKREIVTDAGRDERLRCRR